MPIVIGKICKKQRLYGSKMQKIKNKLHDSNAISNKLKKAKEIKEKLEQEKAAREEQLRISAAEKLHIESGLPYMRSFYKF